MPRGDKSSYTDKQKRQAQHIEEGYEKRGVPEKEAERRAWATENKISGGEKNQAWVRTRKNIPDFSAFGSCPQSSVNRGYRKHYSMSCNPSLATLPQVSPMLAGTTTRRKGDLCQWRGPPPYLHTFDPFDFSP